MSENLYACRVTGWPQIADLPDALLAMGDTSGQGMINLHEFRCLATVMQGNAALRQQLGA